MEVINPEGITVHLSKALPSISRSAGLGHEQRRMVDTSLSSSIPSRGCCLNLNIRFLLIYSFYDILIHILSLHFAFILLVSLKQLERKLLNYSNKLALSISFHHRSHMLVFTWFLCAKRSLSKPVRKNSFQFFLILLCPQNVSMHLMSN